MGSGRVSQFGCPPTKKRGMKEARFPRSWPLPIGVAFRPGSDLPMKATVGRGYSAIPRRRSEQPFRVRVVLQGGPEPFKFSCDLLLREVLLPFGVFK